MSTKDDLDNHSNQLNPNNDEYWNSRGYRGRSEDCDVYQDNPIVSFLG